MAGEPIVTIIGNIASEPDLKFTQSGKPVIGFTLVQNNRIKDGDQWKDGEPTWFRVNAWDKLAENAAESLQKGQRVIVQGRMSTRSWETREGEKRTSLELLADAIGPDLRFATATVTKVERSGSAPSGSVQRSSGPAQSDPWATAGDEPPF